MTPAFLSGLCRISLLLGILSVLGCESSALPESVKRRSGTVVIESCALDPFQQSALLSDDARAVVSDIVLLCLYIRDDVATPTAPADRASVAQVVSLLRQRGYRVQLGVTTGEPTTLMPSKLDALLRDPARRAVLSSSIADAAKLADGIVIAPPQLASSSEPAFRAWITELAAMVPSRRVSLFAPPSTMTPSDIPGGDAINVAALRDQLAQVYLMTLDLHCCDGQPGPTTSADWISQVAAFAQDAYPTSSLSITVPLYGTHFGSQNQRPVSYLEAVGIAGHEHIEIVRTNDGTLRFDYQEPGGALAHVYFDDAQSTLQTLSQVDETVPNSVGVVYYGVGGEDPSLWRTLKERMK